MCYITTQRLKADPTVHVAQGRTSKFLGSREMIPGSWHAHWTPGKPAVILLRQSLLLSVLLWGMGVDGARLPLVSENCPGCLEHPLISPYKTEGKCCPLSKGAFGLLYPDCLLSQAPCSSGTPWNILLGFDTETWGFISHSTHRLAVLFSDSPHPLRTTLQSRIQMILEFDSRAERRSMRDDTETLAVGLLILRSTPTESRYQ